MEEVIKEITSKEAWEFLKDKHYAGRRPPISKAFSLEISNQIMAVCTFGKPASRPLCVGICGKEYADNVFELNRLCRLEEYTGQLSHFVSTCLKKLKKENWIIVSYSDTDMHHAGYIYQACNFLYTGLTKERTDKYVEGNKHCRHYKEEEQGKYRRVRSAKHRYVYFASYKNSLKRKWKEALNYPILPYPKTLNKNYVLGFVQSPRLVKVR